MRYTYQDIIILATEETNGEFNHSKHLSVVKDMSTFWYIFVCFHMSASFIWNQNWCYCEVTSQGSSCHTVQCSRRRSLQFTYVCTARCLFPAAVAAGSRPLRTGEAAGGEQQRGQDSSAVSPRRCTPSERTVLTLPSALLATESYWEKCTFKTQGGCLCCISLFFFF